MNAAHVTAVPALASGGVNATAIGILLAIFVPVCAAVAAIVVSFYRLQRHRADPLARAEVLLRQPARSLLLRPERTVIPGRR